jgi:hypothetical protein
MSAKVLAACSFEPPVEQAFPTDNQPPESLAAGLQFREALWREYRREAINAGASAAQAAEYASALSPELGLPADASATAPAGRDWFYQSRIQVVERSIASGLIRAARWEKSKAAGRAEARDASIFAPGFRPWNMGDKS